MQRSRRDDVAAKADVAPEIGVSTRRRNEHYQEDCQSRQTHQAQGDDLRG